MLNEQVLLENEIVYKHVQYSNRFDQKTMHK